MNYVARFTETRTLWISFFATILILVVFQIVVREYDLILLDTLSDPEASRAAIASMSDSQLRIHAWITGTLDVVYPAVYGTLFIGSAYKFFPRAGFFLAVPILFLVAIDLMEGVVQIFALANIADWLAAKVILTPAKLWLFYFGLLIILCGWITWLAARLRSTLKNTQLP